MRLVLGTDRLLRRRGGGGGGGVFFLYFCVGKVCPPKNLLFKNITPSKIDFSKMYPLPCLSYKHMNLIFRGIFQQILF